MVGADPRPRKTTSARLHVLALEPYHGGSHADFLRGLARHSRHRWAVRSLPARKWKWRVRQAPVAFARDPRPDPDAAHPDVVVASDFLNVAEWKGLAPARLARLPLAVYFHENQLTYPVRCESERDYHFGWSNFVTAVAADEVWFNSAFHRREFLDALPAFVRRMPDGDFSGEMDGIAARSRILHPGVHRPAADGVRPRPRAAGPLRILWNHRWEFDKAPERFFAALDTAVARDARFELVVLGQRFRDEPDVFRDAHERFADRVLHWGFEPDPDAYARRVAQCDVAVSTAIHEFFGLAVVEAMIRGCRPLLPDRLSYPELLPPASRDEYLYRTDDELAERIVRLAADPERTAGIDPAWTERFAWEQRIEAFDAAVEELAGHGS